MKDSDRINAELTAVVKALERPGLSTEQAARGWKRYDELQTKLQAAYRFEAEEHIKFIRETIKGNK